MKVAFMQKSFTVFICLIIGVSTLWAGEQHSKNEQEQMALELLNRGVSISKTKDAASAVVDWTIVIEMKNISVKTRALALVDRGIILAESGNSDGAISDFTTIIEMKDVPLELKAKALCNRAKTRDDGPGILADCAAVIEMTNLPKNEYINGLPPEEIMMAKQWKKMVEVVLGQVPGEITAATAIIDASDTTREAKAKALFDRAVCKRQLGDMSGAIGDWTAAIEVKGIISSLKANALNFRAKAKGREGDTKGAVGDLTTVIEMADVPSEQKILALFNRGLIKSRTDDLDGAMADFTTIVKMKDVDTKVKDNSLFHYAILAHRRLENGLPREKKD